MELLCRTHASSGCAKLVVQSLTAYQALCACGCRAEVFCWMNEQKSHVRNPSVAPSNLEQLVPACRLIDMLQKCPSILLF